MEAISPYQHTAQMYLMLKRAEVATEEHSTEYNHNINIQKIKSLNLTNHVAIPYLMMVSKCISELKSLSLGLLHYIQKDVILGTKEQYHYLWLFQISKNSRCVNYLLSRCESHWI